MLKHINFRVAPFELMQGVLSLTQALFYPTDDAHHDETLAYYRQREWRLVAGPAVRGRELARRATDDEKKELLSIDERFWDRTIQAEDGTPCRRVDLAAVVDTFDGRPIADSCSCILVPPEAYDAARRLFGERVTLAPGSSLVRRVAHQFALRLWRWLA
ncbi:MAG: hypothetical protein ACRENE_01055 [Polyangiaceae bacterium]